MYTEMSGAGACSPRHLPRNPKPALWGETCMTIGVSTCPFHLSKYERSRNDGGPLYLPFIPASIVWTVRPSDWWIDGLTGSFVIHHSVDLPFVSLFIFCLGCIAVLFFPSWFSLAICFGYAFNVHHFWKRNMV